MASLFVRGMELTSKESYFPLFSEHQFISKIDPLNSLVNAIFFYLFDPILAANLISLLYIGISLFVTYKLFRALSNAGNKYLAVIFALLYTFSIHFLYRLISFTPNLMQIFIFPGLVYLVWIKKIKTWKLAFILLGAFAFTSYYGFFALIMCGTMLFLEGIFTKGNWRQKSFKVLKEMGTLVLPLIFGLALIFFSSFIQNFKPITSQIGSTTEEKRVVYRPIEEYYNLSFRPWYFFIPPKNSVFFGDISKDIYQQIQNTNYYLADDYTEEEAAGSFMGWHFMLGIMLTVLILGLSKSKHKYTAQALFPNVYSNIDLIIKSVGVIFVILLISQPPSFTISGITFYTPSYILYMIAPVFRSLVRLSTVIYLFVLIINYFFILDLFQLKPSKSYKALFTSMFLAINYIIFAIKIPIIDFSNPPGDISFLNTIQSEQSIVVYPKADYYSIFWITKHRHKLLNPVDYKTSELIDSEKISKELVTIEGIKNAKDLGASILVYYKNSGQKRSDETYNLDELFENNFGPKIFSNETANIYQAGNP